MVWWESFFANPQMAAPDPKYYSSQRCQKMINDWKTQCSDYWWVALVTYIFRVTNSVHFRAKNWYGKMFWLIYENGKKAYLKKFCQEIAGNTVFAKSDHRPADSTLLTIISCTYTVCQKKCPPNFFIESKVLFELVKIFRIFFWCIGQRTSTFLW